ncbi:MAG: cation transporter [Candidatus Odinarchaeota archaeon]|nr:cation transporter [Candidatus Odinarchaeota archaeon]
MSKTSLATILKFSIVLYFLSSTLKIYGGFVSNSLSLIADGFDSLINVVSSSFAFFSFILSQKPADEEHPYGHYGFEILSVIVTNFLMIALGAVVLVLALIKLEFSYMVAEVGIFYGFVTTTIIATATLSTFILARRTGSLSLKAESRHLFVDSVESILVLGGVFLSVSYSYLFDIVSSILVSSLMFYGALRNTLEIYDSIVYKLPGKELIKKIEALIHSFESVKECHKIRIRKLGAHLFIDMHVLVSENTSLYEAHKLTVLIEDALKREIPNIADVIIHLEPFEYESLTVSNKKSKEDKLAS